jgi:N-glycosylase/DNA lyase
MLVTENEIFDVILSEYSRLEMDFYRNKKWNEMSESELWRELCLCILSSNVPYELAQSAFFHLVDMGYLSLKWITKTKNSQKIIASELRKSIYLPRKLDSSYRKYRFPNIRSENIHQAAKMVSSDEVWLSKLLKNSTSERATRDFLVANISGLGLKEASHFLRNIRYSNQLAIIDSHVISFLVKIRAVPQRNTKTITRRIYLELEATLQDICDKHKLSLSIFDMAVWECMRRK